METIPIFNETEWQRLLNEVFGDDEPAKLVMDLRRQGTNLLQANQLYKSQGLPFPIHTALRKFRAYVKEHGVSVDELFTEASQIDLAVDQAWRDRRRLQGRATDLDSVQDKLQTLL